MRYPFDDPEAVMICSREREREKEIRNEKHGCAFLCG
jgi:hypothetical protein